MSHSSSDTEQQAPTPRTDAFRAEFLWQWREFAEQIERELAFAEAKNRLHEKFQSMEAPRPSTLPTCNMGGGCAHSIKCKAQGRCEYPARLSHVAAPSGENAPGELEQVYRDLMDGTLVLVRNWFTKEPYCAQDEQAASKAICSAISPPSAIAAPTAVAFVKDADLTAQKTVDTVARDAARYRFRHSNYKDADGYEYGYCKVRWNPNGTVDSMVWAEDDEIDAAMSAAVDGGTKEPK